METVGEALANRFFEILALPDEEKVGALEGFLAPEFQLVRATGDRLDRATYLAAPATVHEWRISEVRTTSAPDLLVVSYLVATTETLDGLEQTTTAPRLSVFRSVDGTWMLAAHSNFGAISTTTATPEPSAS
jgi:hypothetical protein